MTVVLVSPDSFKGTHPAQEVARAIAEGVRAAGGEAIECPVADGGEGTLDILLARPGVEERRLEVNGPVGQRVEARWGWDAAERTAFVESAQACGLHLVDGSPEQAVAASSAGLGEIMEAALGAGASRIVVTLGGTGTSDGGRGMLSVLPEVPPGVQVEALSDVDVAYEDAARVFGPQKGADAAAVEELTARLHETAGLLASRFGRDPRGRARTGAAGGLSGALWAAYGAELRSGADAVLDLVGFDAKAATADVVVVGEGRLDSQSFEGKIVSGVLARVDGLPAVAVVGSRDLDDAEAASRGLVRVWTAGDPGAMRRAGEEIVAWIRQARPPRARHYA